MKKPLIVIAGPTASGKTDTAVLLAKKINGEIISADSMQVYKYMDIGTAKPAKEEMQGIKHYLIDELYPDEQFNVMVFQKKAKQYMEEIYEKGKIPIIVGGTGFYINALINDIHFVPTNDDESYRKELYEMAKKQGANVLHQKLQELDPVSANTIHENNIKRVTRAIEFYHLTGKKFSEYNEEEKKKQSPYNTAFFIFNMEREKLYKRINLRVDKMIEQGLVQEVKNLLEKGYIFDLVSMQGLGYKEMIPYIRGEITIQQAIEQLKQSTRHFAKRQLTWFRRQNDGIWLDLTNCSKECIINDIYDYLAKLNIWNEEQ